MILTIAIPTYNRPDKVKNTVVRLLSQLTAEVKIVVLDNCSTVNVEKYLEDNLGAEVSKKIEVVRNRVNIGADANFMRCFEICETPYIWMLGDDDKIEDHAVQLILQELEEYKHLDLISINFASNVCLVDRTMPVIINSTTELVNKLDFFGNMLFISTSVYRVEEYLKNISFSMWGAFSMASQVVATLIAVSKGKILVLSEKHLVDHVNLLDVKEKWSNIQITLGLSTILETNFGLKNDEYVKLGRHFNINLFSSIPAVFFTIIRSVNYRLVLIDNYHVYLFKQIYYRTCDFRPHKFKNWIYFNGGKFLLNNVIVLRLVVKLLPGFFTKKANSYVPFNLFVR
jgi:glycosyltransferase involved in cell wall biosynthesis